MIFFSRNCWFSRLNAISSHFQEAVAQKIDFKALLADFDLKFFVKFQESKYFTSEDSSFPHTIGQPALLNSGRLR